MTVRGRILFVDHAAVLGGAELSLLDIAEAHRDLASVALFEDGPFREALEQRGVSVVVLGGGSALRSIKKGSVVPGAGALMGVLFTARQLRHLAAGAAVLYANSPKSMIVSVLASIGTRTPVVWHLRDILGRDHFSRLNIRASILLANRAVARVIANSQATADAFIAAGGDPARVRVVHNGIDSGPFDALPATARGDTRTSLGIPQDAFVIGSFSRLHPWKGQHVLLDAIAGIPAVHALVVGGALFSGDDAYEAALRTRSSAPPLAGRVHLTGSRRDVSALMSACDVIVHTSVLPEPFGRVLVEAMLARRPVIAADAGGVREIIRRDVTGLLVPPGDASALATAIQHVRADPALVAALVDAGAADARARFSRDSMLRGVDAVLDDIAGTSR